MNFLWVGVGGCELFMGECGLLWTFYRWVWVGMGGCDLLRGGWELVWVDAGRSAKWYDRFYNLTLNLTDLIWLSNLNDLTLNHVFDANIIAYCQQNRYVRFAIYTTYSL